MMKTWVTNRKRQQKSEVKLGVDLLPNYCAFADYKLTSTQKF